MIGNRIDLTREAIDDPNVKKFLDKLYEDFKKVIDTEFVDTINELNELVIKIDDDLLSRLDSSIKEEIENHNSTIVGLIKQCKNKPTNEEKKIKKIKVKKKIIKKVEMITQI